MKVVVSVKAYADLQRAYLFVSERDQAAAERIISDIHERFSYLAWFPRLGRP